MLIGRFFFIHRSRLPYFKSVGMYLFLVNQHAQRLAQVVSMQLQACQFPLHHAVGRRPVAA